MTDRELHQNGPNETADPFAEDSKFVSVAHRPRQDLSCLLDGVEGIFCRRE